MQCRSRARLAISMQSCYAELWTLEGDIFFLIQFGRNRSIASVCLWHCFVLSSKRNQTHLQYLKLSFKNIWYRPEWSGLRLLMCNHSVYTQATTTALEWQMRPYLYLEFVFCPLRRYFLTDIASVQKLDIYIHWYIWLYCICCLCIGKCSEISMHTHTPTHTHPVHSLFNVAMYTTIKWQLNS